MNKSILSLLNNDLAFIALQKGRAGRLGRLKGVVSPSFVCTLLYRTSHSLHLTGIPLLPKVFWWLNILLFSSDIDHRARLYAALYLPHPLAIVIGHQVQMYGTAKIMQGVTFGGNLGSTASVKGEEISQPRTEGKVFVGPGSMVLGPVELSGSLFIGGMAMVTSSVIGEGVVVKKTLSPLTDAQRKELGCAPINTSKAAA